MEIVFDTRIIANNKHKKLLTKHYDFIVLWGGRGSSKTSDAIKVLVKECLELDYFKCVVVFPNQGKITEGVYSEIKDFIVSYGLGELFDFTTSPHKILCNLNDNSFIFKGGQEKNPKGIAKPNRAFYEEVDTHDEDTHDKILTSLRSVGGSLKVFYTFNPESEGMKYKDHWVYKRFFAHEVDKGTDIYSEFEFTSTITNPFTKKEETFTGISIHSTLDDNQYCPVGLINNIEGLKFINPTRYKIWRHGKWSAKDNSNQYAHLFKESLHVKELDIKPDYPIHISVDQNFLPFATALIFQTYLEGEDIIIHAVDEICLPPPTNSSEEICDAILKRYGNYRMYLYGDYSGKSRTMKIQKTPYLNHYDMIKEKLRLNLAQGGFKVKPNPKRAIRRDITNTMLEGRNGFKLVINPKCVNFINDLEQMETDVNGVNYVKTKGKEGWEIVGHLHDTYIYFLFGCYPDLFKK